MTKTQLYLKKNKALKNPTKTNKPTRKEKN